jgi:acylphosphatase
MNRVRANVIVSGRVQGVFFRDTARQTAERLSVSGWVRNRPDGRVEAEFQGQRDAVEEAIAFCRSGPPQADVARVDVAWLEPTDGEHGFSIR